MITVKLKYTNLTRVKHTELSQQNFRASRKAFAHKISRHVILINTQLNRYHRIMICLAILSSKRPHVCH